MSKKDEPVISQETIDSLVEALKHIKKVAEILPPVDSEAEDAHCREMVKRSGTNRKPIYRKKK